MSKTTANDTVGKELARSYQELKKYDQVENDNVHLQNPFIGGGRVYLHRSNQIDSSQLNSSRINSVRVKSNQIRYVRCIASKRCGAIGIFVWNRDHIGNGKTPTTDDAL